MSETEDPNSQGGILKASSPGVDQIAVGMTVSSVDGHEIGKVKEIAATEFLVDRPIRRDPWSPFRPLVQTSDRGGTFPRGPTMATEVVLSVTYEDLHSQGWRHP